MATNRPQCPPSATASVRLVISLLVVCALFAPIASADPFPPYFGNGTANPAGPIHFVPVAWPSEPQWIAYTRNDAPIKDPRVQDPSNGGTSPQNYVNVSSGCPDQTLPSVYYYYNPVTRVIFYRWRVEQRANNYATGPSAGSASSSNPWNSALWTVMLDLDGDGYRDFAIHLNGSSGSPSTQIDVLNAIWSPTKTNSIDYTGDPTNIHLISHNPTAFIQGTSGNSNGSILQFDGNGNVSTTQWPNGSSETTWDYGTTRSIDVSTSGCEEYFVDYQIPLDMLDATAFGGPKLDVNTPFSFVFATANSLNNPFQKDVVLDGAYVCPPTAPAPFGDPLTLNGGIIKQPIVRSITTGNVSASCTIPVTAAILDALNITNCQTISTLTTAKFFYYYDSNGDGLDNDGGTWTFFSNGTPTGTTVTGSLDVSTLLRGHYLIAIELTDGALPTHNVMQSWLYTATPFSPIFGATYGNVPTAGVSTATKGVNFTTIDVANPCGGAPPTVTKTASVVAPNVDGTAQAGGTVTYTLNIKNNSATAITISSITDSLPPGFTWVSNVAGTLTATPPTPAGSTGTITWTLSPAVTIAGNDATTYTFKFNATAPLQQGTYYNSGSFVTNVGTFLTGQAPVTVRTATMAVSKSNFDATTASSSVANRGDNITYTINYANTSGIPTTSVVLTDVLPAGFTYNGGSASVAPTSVNTVSGVTTLTWNIGSVAANTTPAPITFTAVATLGGLQTNNVTLTSTEAPTVTGSASIFVNGPVLTISKTPSQTRVVPAGGLTYTVVVQNTGNASATLTSLTDAYPNVAPTLTYASSSPAGCTAATAAGVTTVTCTAANGGLPASLAAGAALSYTFTFSASSGSGNITDTATINSSNAAAATAQATINVSPNGTCSQVSQTKYYFRNISPAFTVPAVGATSMNRNALTTAGTTNTASALFTTGTNVEIARFYQDPPDATNASLITFDGANNNVQLFYEKDGGNKIVSGVTVNDFNPATQTWTQIASVTGGGVQGTGGTPQFNISDALKFPAGSYTLPAGHRVLWIIKVTDSNAGNATTGKLEYDGAAASNFDSYGSLCIVPIQAPSVAKFGDKPQATPGVGNVVYTIPYANTAAGTLAGATITDTLPAGMTYVSGTGITGKVASISITNGGSGYTTNPTVTIAGCTGATATSNIDGNGVVTQVNVTNSGSACGAATVTFGAPPAGVTATGTVNLTGISVAGQVVTYTLGTLPANGTAGSSGSVTLTASVAAGISGTSATNNVSMTNSFTGSASASATTTFVRPNVTISKTVSNAAPAPGASFSYTITVLNGGNGAAAGVVVTDDFPSSSLNFVSATSASTTCSYSAPTITCTSFGLASGAAATITVNATVPTSVSAGQTTVTNTAHVVDSFDTTPRNAGVNVTITGTPTLTLTKTSALNPLVGARLVYVNVTSGGSGYTSAPAVTVNGCTGATATAYVSGGVITAISVTNYGTQCSSPSLSLVGGGGAGATFTLVTGAAPGDTITYTLTAKNLSGTATTTGVVINDTIPAYTSYGSGADSFSGATGTATFNIGSIAAGTSAVARTYTVTVNSTVPTGVTTLSTTPTATSTNAGSASAVPPVDFTGANPVYTINDSPSGTKPYPEATISGALPSASTTFTVSSASLMAVGDYIVVQNGGGYSVTQISAINGTTVTVSTPITATSATIYPAVVYSVPYANTGNVSGTPTVSVTLPAGLNYAGIPSGYPAVTSAPAVGNSGTITWGTGVIGTVLSGGSGVLQFVAFPTAAGTYTNTATITDGLRNATASATTVFGALNPSKSTTTPSLVNQSPTNIAHYVITVTNPLATAATTVTITDNLPEGFTYRSGSTVGTSAPGGTSPSPVWTVASLAGNSTLTFSFDADISANTPNGVYQNEVLVSSANARSLVFDYLGTTAEDVIVCNPVPAIIAPDVCGSSVNDYAVVPVTPAASYLWSITNGGGTITSSTSGTGMVARVTVGNGGSGYTAGLTNVVFTGGGGGSGATATATVAGGVVAAVTITNPGSGYNSAPSVSFTGSGTGASAASTLGNGIRYTAGANGTVAIQVSMTTGSCSAVIGTKTVNITAVTAPSASNGGPYCVGGTIGLSTPAVAGATYSWTGPNGFTSSAQNPTVAATLAAAGTYNVTITANGCTSAAGSTTVVVNATPATPTASNDGPICSGGTANLSTPTVATASYLWTGPNGFTSSSQNPTATDAGTYFVTVTVNSCTSAAGSTTLVVNATPSTPTASNDGPICSGGTANLSTPTVAGAMYSWTGPGGFTSSAQNPTATIAGTYFVTVTVSGCTSAAGSTTLVVNATPATPSASNDGPICSGGTANLSTPTVAGATYSWTGPGGFTSSAQNPTATIAGTYFVTVTVNSCTSAAGSTTVVVNATPATPSASNDGPICSGGTANLSTPTVAGATYSWTGPSGFTSSAQNPTATIAGTYFVTVTVIGCTSAAGSTTLVVNATPATPSASNDGPICSGGAANLSTPTVAGATYSWTGPGGFTSSAQNPTATIAGTYFVTVTVSGCTSAAGSTTLVVNATPATPSASNDGPICSGGTANLSTPTVAGATYSWTGPGGFTSSAQNPTATIAGTYSVTVTVSGCTSAAGSTTLVVNANPTATITPSGPTTFCAGGSVTLTASGGTSYLWSTGAMTAAITVSTSGTYMVTTTDASSCTSTPASQTVTVNPLPTAAITPSGPTTFCAGGSVTLTASGGTSYLWSTGATTAAITVSSSGTYTVTTTNGNGCTSTPASQTVTVNPLPTATITPGGPTTFCAGGSVTLTASGSVSYLWSTGATTAAITVSSSGTYTVTTTDGNGCTSTPASQTVTVNPLPTATITPSGPTTFCAGGSVTLTASGGTSYLWSTGATTAAITVSSSGTYTVTTTDGNGCTSTAASQTVTMNPLPTATITPSGPTTFCAGGSVTLTASGGVSYLWSTGATTPAITVSSSGTYTVTTTNGNGCTSTPASQTVTVNPLPTATITPSGPTTFCAGGSVTLTASGGVSYLWSTGATTAAITVSASGTYTVTTTDANGCASAPASQTVTVNSLPTATITPSGPTTFCAGGSATLTASGGVSYLWSTGATTAAITVSTSGTYTVTTTDVNGCTSAPASQTVTVNPLPTATITPSGPTIFCAGGSVTLTASAGVSYLWSTGATTAAITVSTSGTYTVTTTDGNGCTSAPASRTVTVNPLPTATITPSGPTTFCAGGSVTLTASGGVSYLWSTGATTAAITVSTSGTYTVTTTDGSGCTSAPASQTVTVNPLPTATITPSGPTTFCAGGSVTLTASGGTGYVWSTGATTAAITVSTSGTYTVTTTDANGCTSTPASQTVTVNPLPTATITPSGATTFCAGGSVTLTASGGVSYLWSTGATTAAITVSTSGTYTVTTTDANGCPSAPASQTVTVNPLPTATITPSGSMTFCAGGSVTLTASGGVSYLWSTGATTAAITVSTSGTYTVATTDANGCTSAPASKTVTVNPLPTATITPSGATTFCSGGSVTLTASGGVSYLWSTGATTAAITVSTSGTYTVTTTDANGCTSAPASKTVTVNPLPTATITPSGATTFCAGGSVTLTASGGVSYLWSTGATTAAITVSTSGTYTVATTDANGCTSIPASRTVTVNPLPTATITPSGPATFCAGGSVTLTASGGVSYFWSTGVTTAAITVSTSGTYTVTTTDGTGCTSAPASQTVTVNPLPTATITPSGPTTFCAGGSVTLTASGGTGYVWSTGATTAAITVSTSGTYTVATTDANGCTSTPASQTVTVNPLPTATITPSGATTFCAGGSVTLTASGGASYLWSTGATTAAITVSTSGTYTVATTDANGCTSAPASQTVTVNPLPTATITPSGPTTFCASGSVTLTASGGVSYLWSTGATTAAITVSTSGTYTVTTTDANGCTSTPASQTVTVNPLPTATITPSGATTFCAGGGVTLTASGGTSYLWSTGATTAAITVSTSGTYTVTTTDANGCTSTPASQTVTVNPLPTATITPSGATTFCAGGSVTLTASGGVSYLWSTGATTAAITVSTSGTYTVTTTDANGCTSTPASQTVTVNPLPTATITPSGPTTFCAGGGVTLTASGGTSYLWSTGATTSAISVSASGTYTVTTTDGNSCTSTPASQTVTVNPLPAATITPNGPTSFCTGDNVTLMASGGVSYLWSTGATTAAITVSTSGTYTVTTTDANGCTSAPASQTVTVNPIPAATITPSGPTTFCGGGSVTLTASGGTSYLWSTGAKTAAITVSTTGTYTVTTTTGGCTSPAAGIDVVANAAPATPVASNGGPFCSGSVVTLNVQTVAGGTYAWSGPNGFTSPEQNPTIANATSANSGTYLVTVTVGFCTSPPAATDVVVAAAVAAPVAGNGGPYCAGQKIALTASGIAGGSYFWIGPNGFTSTEQSPVLDATASAAGTYTVVATVNGCSSQPASTIVVVGNGCSTPVPVDLVVSKSVDNATPSEGSVVTYAVKVVNTGAGPATAIAIHDALPAGTTLVSAMPAGAYESLTGTWTIPTLAEGATATLSLKATINVGQSGNNITNCASLTLSTPSDVNAANNTACAPLIVLPPDLEVVKTVDIAVPAVGDTIHYTILVRNLGPGIASFANIVVSDVLPNTVNLVGFTATQGTWTPSDGNWAIGTLAVNASATLNITAKVNQLALTTKVRNCATLTLSSPPDVNAANNQSCAPVDLAVTKTVDKTVVHEGEVIRYTVRVKNNGPSYATGVVISTPQNAMVTVTGWAASQGTYNASTSMWSAGSLAVGEEVVLYITAVINGGIAPATIVDCATLNASAPLDDDSSNNQGCISISVLASAALLPDIIVTKSVDHSTASEGDTVSYTIRATNAGPGTATNVVVGDTLPGALALTNASATNGSYANGVWSIGDLAQNQTATLVLSATIQGGAGAGITNCASLSSADGNAANNQSCAALQVITLGACSNNPPQLSVPLLQNIEPGRTLRFRVAGIDPDGDAVTLSVGDLPTSARFSATTGVFTFSPTDLCDGEEWTYTPRFVATDSRGGMTTVPVQISVVRRDAMRQHVAAPVPNGVRREPVIAIPQLPVRVAAQSRFPVTALSQEADCATDLVMTTPELGSFDAATGVFTASSAAGHVVRFRAADCRGRVSTAIVPIATGAATPRAVVSVNKLTFGSTRTGSDRGSMLVTLTNAGEATLHVDSVKFRDGSAFRVEGADLLPVDLRPATALELRVLFQPSAAGHLEDQLEIVTSDPAARVKNVAVEGIAVAAEPAFGNASSATLPVLAQQYFISNTPLTIGPSTNTARNASCINREPVLSVPSLLTAEIGRTLHFRIAATDPDGDAVALGAANLPFGAFLDSATGDVTYTPVEGCGLEADRVVDLTFIAADSNGATTSAPVQIVIGAETSEHPATAPILSVPAAPIEAKAGEPVRFRVAAISADSGCAATVVRVGSVGRLDPLTGEFAVTAPATGDSDAVVVPFRVTDCSGLSSTRTARIAISNVSTMRAVAAVDAVSFAQTVKGTASGYVVVPITNDGTRPLRIARVGLASGANFRIDGALGMPVTLQPGQSLPVRVEFVPTAAGSLNDTLQVEATDAATVSVAVSGVSVN